MVDTIFNTSEAVPAVSPEVEDLVTTDGLDVDGNVLLGNSSGLKISDDGVITSKTGAITFNSIRDISLFETAQTITPTAATTPVNLDIASTVVLNHTMDTTISLTPSSGGVRFFLLLRKKDAAPDARSLAFTGGLNWIGEQSTLPVWTQAPSAEDIIWGFVDNDGSLISRLPVANYTPRNTKSGGVYWRRGAAKYLKQPRPVPENRVAGVSANQIITGMADKTLNAASIKAVAHEFPNEIDALALLLNKKDIPVTFTPTNGTVAINATVANLYKINNQDGDITNVTLALHESGNGVDEPIITILYRVKDTTENPYTIYFDPAVYTYEGDPVFTQTPGAADFYIIYSIGGVNYLSWANNFGVL